MPSFFCMPFMACNRQIDSLDRRSADLQTFPHDIERHARTLEELLLDMNHIKELPKALFRLSKLRRLSIRDNDLYRLPPEIASLASLVELNLSGNDITDIPEELKECKELMILVLSSNPITRLPATISQLTSLTHLGLNDVSLTQLPVDIGQLCNLKSLEVRENLIRTLPPSITQLNKLQVLDLGQNELDQLPSDMAGLMSLREFYVDNNDLEILPEEITMCSCMEQMDVCNNNIMLLPDDFGNLANMSDLNLSDNKLQGLPDSIGRMKKLQILKADKNALIELTQSIGSCSSLEELLLTDNMLTEIPSTIGNLKKLRCLNIDKNELLEVPSTIGGCTNLGILSLRSNSICELPMDIGRCEKLAVLDLCSNRLSFLPFTINVLFKLQALWLSENQSQAMLKLQQERDPKTGVKVLTCYLLPQESAQQSLQERTPNRSFVGGPKVHFTDMDNTQDIEERNLPIGQFERHDTPHPKPHAAKLKKNTIDGHIIHHDDEQAQPSALVLSSKRSTSEINPASPQNPDGPTPQPRSALRYQSVPVQQFAPETNAGTPSSANGPIQMVNNPQVPQIQPTTQSTNHVERSVAFAFGDGAELNCGGTKLKRVNTPHYKSHSRPHMVHHHKEMDRSSSSLRPSTADTRVIQVAVKRDEQGGLGLSIAGGLESTAYMEGDNGLFISRVSPGGPAEQAGLRQGDKLLRVNDSDVVGASHETVVRKMQESRDQLELTIQRLDDAPTPVLAFRQSPSQSLDASFMSDNTEMSSIMKETISTLLKRDANGSPGFSVAGGLGSGKEGIFISQISPGGSADRDAKLQVGDRVLSINGTTMRGARHDQAVALLTGHADNEVFLIVQRERPSLTSPLPSTPVVTSSPQPVLPRAPSRSAPLNQLGDTSSWDGQTEEVDLNKDGSSLGLSIVGGSDHSSHPFGVNFPGVFISKIAAGSPAARSHRIRIGDRILAVNAKDVRNAKHIEAVEALKSSGSRVKLLVQHDPQPVGLLETSIHRRDRSEKLGISIHGGVGSPPANPTDGSDEGIFIDKVELGSVSESAGLIAGQRIIEVNGESLLGCSQAEAATSLCKANELRLLVCDGYNAPAARTPIQRSGSSPDENSIDRPFSPPSNASIPRSLSPIVGDGFPPPPMFSSLSDAPLATSSPLPPQTAPKPLRVPPPVAPKPTLKASQLENIKASTTGESAQPERLNFNSKLQKFEREIEIKRVDKTISQSSLPPPEKKPLLSEQDMRKLKEEEAKKLLIDGVQIAPLDSPEKDRDTFFEHLLEDSPIPKNGSAPTRIRTKNAELRAIASGKITPSEEPLNEIERRALEQQKRSEWRAARLKSLDQERAEADAIMCKLQLGNMLGSIQEDRSSPLNERVLANETSMQREVHTNPVTGEHSVTVVEKSVTKREIDISNGSDIGFADD